MAFPGFLKKLVASPVLKALALVVVLLAVVFAVVVTAASLFADVIVLLRISKMKSYI